MKHPKRKWPVEIWFENMPQTAWKARKKDIIDLLRSGDFPELELDFPELSGFSKHQFTYPRFVK